MSDQDKPTDYNMVNFMRKQSKPSPYLAKSAAPGVFHTKHLWQDSIFQDVESERKASEELMVEEWAEVEFAPFPERKQRELLFRAYGKFKAIDTDTPIEENPAYLAVCKMQATMAAVHTQEDMKASSWWLKKRFDDEIWWWFELRKLA